MRNFFKWNEVLFYFFRKKDNDHASSFNIRVMHVINKIAILVFLGGIIFFIIKKIFF